MSTQELSAVPIRLAYSPSEFAHLSGLSLPTVRRRLAAGDILSTRLRGRILIPRDEIARVTGVTLPDLGDIHAALVGLHPRMAAISAELQRLIARVGRGPTDPDDAAAIEHLERDVAAVDTEIAAHESALEAIRQWVMP